MAMTPSVSFLVLQPAPDNSRKRAAARTKAIDASLPHLRFDFKPCSSCSANLHCTNFPSLMRRVLDGTACKAFPLVGRLRLSIGGFSRRLDPGRKQLLIQHCL